MRQRCIRGRIPNLYIKANQKLSILNYLRLTTLLFRLRGELVRLIEVLFRSTVKRSMQPEIPTNSKLLTASELKRKYFGVRGEGRYLGF